VSDDSLMPTCLFGFL